MWFNLEIFSIALLLLFPSSRALAYPRPVLDAQLISDTQLIEREEADALAPKASIRSAYGAGVFARAEELSKRKGGGGGKGGSGYVSSSSRGSNGGSSGESKAGGTRSGSPSRSSTSMTSSRSGGRLGDWVLEGRMPKGGGGRHGRGRGGSSSSKPGSDNFHSSSGRGSSSSSAGGATKQGSGVQPSYSGGRYYGGGATSPYTSGGRSPLAIHTVSTTKQEEPIVLPIIPAAGVASNSITARNLVWMRRSPSLAYVQLTQNAVVMQDNGNTTFLDALIGDGTYSQLNQSVVNVVDLNGTSTIVLNGTLPNGTTISGGTDDANVSAGMKKLLEASGYWVMIALAGCTVLLV